MQERESPFKPCQWLVVHEKGVMHVGTMANTPEEAAEVYYSSIESTTGLNRKSILRIQCVVNLAELENVSAILKSNGIPLLKQ